MDKRTDSQLPEEGVDRGILALVRSLRILFGVLRLAIVVFVVVALLQGMFYVHEHENAMLFRFGRLVSKGGRQVLESGRCYWGYPYPIDDVTRIPAQRSERILAVGFWPLRDINVLEGGADSLQQDLIPGQSGYLLTGDANIMHMLWALAYRVTDAKRYYLDFFHDPEPDPNADAPPRLKGIKKTIESLLEQEVLAETATWSVEDVYGLTRGAAKRSEDGSYTASLDRAVQARVEARVRALGLGVEIDQVSLVEIHPPLATAPAFREVDEADMEAQTARHAAEAYRERVVAEAQGRASQITAEAHQYHERITKSLEAEKKYFEDLLPVYENRPEALLAQYTETIRQVLEQAEAKYVIHAKQGGEQEVRLLLSPEPKEAPSQGQDSE